MQYEHFIPVEQDIREKIESSLEHTGLMYRVYSRIKNEESVNEKIKRKDYVENGKLIQDFIGVRIMTYFGEDIEILINYFSSIFEVVDFEQDKMDVNSFSPVRINMVCRLQGQQLAEFEKCKYVYDLQNVDSTFEIQLRTTLSEGWHEIEHNMRYKCKNEWESLENESLLLNGIHATLVTSDQTLAKLFDEIAYQHYKNKNWTGMLRNKFRLRFDMNPLSTDIVSLFNKNKNLAKSFYKLNRREVIYKVIKHDLDIDISFDNIIYLCNYLYVNNHDILNFTPKPLVNKFRKAFDTEMNKTLPKKIVL